uniref:Uncharacterized protein n=1 Tax=Glossina brevipalpis TaxID=37001 RepID=A0A1A9X0A5_9MUSC
MEAACAYLNGLLEEDIHVHGGAGRWSTSTKGAKLLKVIRQIAVLPDVSWRAYDEVNDGTQSAGTVALEFFTARVRSLLLDIVTSSRRTRYFIRKSMTPFALITLVQAILIISDMAEQSLNGIKPIFLASVMTGLSNLLFQSVAVHCGHTLTITNLCKEHDVNPHENLTNRTALSSDGHRLSVGDFNPHNSAWASFSDSRLENL